MAKVVSLTQRKQKQKYSDLFHRIGEEHTIRTVCYAFYDSMEKEPFAERLRSIHSDDLTDAREKLYLFLVGWLGGPPLFENRYGHPRLRQRHMAFDIDTGLVTQWLFCMDKALSTVQLTPSDRELIYQRLTQLAHHMTNHHPTS